MEKEGFLSSKSVKIILPLLIVVLVIALWQKGYGFGQWLYAALH